MLWLLKFKINYIISELAVQQGPGVSLETNLPEFSFSPQEYITQTGEYLMTLPQHLEPFMSGEWNLLFILLFLVLLETPLFFVCREKEYVTFYLPDPFWKCHKIWNVKVSNLSTLLLMIKSYFFFNWWSWTVGCRRFLNIFVCCKMMVELNWLYSIIIFIISRWY